MTPQEFLAFIMPSEDALLRFQADIPDEMTPHTDDCVHCRMRRVMRQVARDMVAKGDTGDGCLRRWAEAANERMKHALNVN